MRVNKWTLGLAACGLVSLPTLMQAEEKMSSVQTALSSTTISGYVNTSAQWQLGTGNANNPAIPFQSGKQDGFNLDVVELTIERPLDEAQWSAGYKAQVLFGPDANRGVGLGTQSQGIGAGSGSDFGIKQAYVDVRAPIGTGLDAKLGVFDTIVGYETFDAGNNPNYTRSYGFGIEPTTHTGLLLTYQLNDMLGVSAGIANTYGPTINEKAWAPGNNRSESYKTYMASLAFTAPKDWGFVSGSTLYFGIINGLNTGYANAGNLNAGAHEDHLYVGGALNTPVAGLKLGASYDYANIDEAPGAGPTAKDAYAWAAALYASFQPADTKFGFHLRGEYATHDNYAPAQFSPFSFTQKVIAITGTVQYDLWKNVLSRVELRWDHAANGQDSFGGTSSGSPDKKNAYLLAANLIYKF